MVDDKAVKRLLARLETRRDECTAEAWWGREAGLDDAAAIVREWAAAERKRAARRKEKR